MSVPPPPQPRRTRPLSRGEVLKEEGPGLGRAGLPPTVSVGLWSVGLVSAWLC